MRILYVSMCCTAMLAAIPAYALKTLPQLQLAQSYQQMELVSDFWISEKLDGEKAGYKDHRSALSYAFDLSGGSVVVKASSARTCITALILWNSVYLL